MKKVVCLLIVFAILVCASGCGNNNTKLSNQVLEIKTGHAEEFEDQFNHDFCFSSRPENIKETVDTPRIEIAFLGQEYQGKYVSTLRYGGDQPDEYVYRVLGAVSDLDPLYPYITIDSNTGHLTAMAAFDFAHISIKDDDTSDSILDKIEEVFEAEVDFSLYTVREASDFHNGYTCDWRRQTSQCKMRSSISISVDAEGNIGRFVREDICDDVPVDYIIPLREEDIAELTTQKLKNIYSTKKTKYIRYEEEGRMLTKYQNKMALILSLAVIINDKSMDRETHDICELLIFLE